MLLEVRSLVTELRTGGGWARVVDDVSFDLDRNRAVAVVGESGCGKSMLALSLMGIVPQQAARVAGGSVRLDGVDLVGLRPERRREVLGRDIAMIFQDPVASLNPVETIGWQICEAIRAHEEVSPAAARARALELLRLVRLADADKRIDDYPHRLSGGMCQRVMIAMALAGRPKLLIADEPTTALDVTIQAQILALLKRIQQETGTAILFITHNLAVVEDIADDVMVMYAGRFVEAGKAAEVFRRPRHPYTRGLLRAIPDFTSPLTDEIGRLPEIRGNVPSPGMRPPGCAYAPRCDRVLAQCGDRVPRLDAVTAVSKVACFSRAEMSA